MFWRRDKPTPGRPPMRRPPGYDNLTEEEWAKLQEERETEHARYEEIKVRVRAEHPDLGEIQIHRITKILQDPDKWYKSFQDSILRKRRYIQADYGKPYSIWAGYSETESPIAHATAVRAADRISVAFKFLSFCERLMAEYPRDQRYFVRRRIREILFTQE
jgi:hypothetical protein